VKTDSLRRNALLGDLGLAQRQREEARLLLDMDDYAPVARNDAELRCLERAPREIDGSRALRSHDRAF
jgi:hypothetical protein